MTKKIAARCEYLTGATEAMHRKAGQSVHIIAAGIFRVLLAQKKATLEYHPNIRSIEL
jgi:hypothetical protein